jgi:hypothetical protein
VQIPGVQVTQGKRYWVAVLGLNGQIEFRDSNSNWWCYSETSYQTALTSLPARWRMGSQYPSCLVSMFGSGGVSTSVSVSLSPQTAALQPAQQTQFMATLSGTTEDGGDLAHVGRDRDQRWPIYSALIERHLTVTATSSADSTKSASASRSRNPLRYRFPFLRTRRIFKPEGSNNSRPPCWARATQAWRGKPTEERSQRLACTLLRPRQAPTP